MICNDDSFDADVHLQTPFTDDVAGSVMLVNHFDEVEGHVTLESGEFAHCDFVVVKFG